jgi:serine/threonine-protein kinase ATR
LNTFSDPTEWLDARTTFTRSCAVWSSVGHIIGLGDRHGENILIDSLNGECMHVDFDCLFDKGLTLAKPEIVPFRLTPNLVDAMGLTGVEGGYRLAMEVALKLLRDNKDILLSVVEPFLRDPTVAWGRGGRAQRDEGGASGFQNGKSSSRSRDEAAPSNTENAIADQTLRIITERLEG